MLPPRKAITPQGLNRLSVRYTSQAQNFSSCVLVLPDKVQPHLQSAHPHVPSHQKLYLNGQRRWTSHKDAKTYRPSVFPDSSSRDEVSKSFHLGSCYTGYLTKDTRRHQSWRLLSSWGKWGYTNSSPKEKSKSDGQEHYDWYADHRRRIQENLERFEEIKRRIDEDPFGALFGRRLRELHPRKPKSSSNLWNGKAETQVSQFDTAIEKRQTDGFDTKSREAKKPEPKTEGSRSRTGDIGQEPAVSSSNVEYDIDPITMRKVLRSPLSQNSSITGTRKNFEESVNIPVKRFVAVTSTMQGQDQMIPSTDMYPEVLSQRKSTESHGNTIPSSQADGNVQDWLAQEGFGARYQAANMAAAAPNMKMQTGSKEPRSSSSKIESALDRHLRIGGIPSERTPSLRSKLQYDVRENKTEDVDLLRASDVRAASGLRGRTRKETAEEQQERRRALAGDYEDRVQSLERQFATEIAARKGKAEQMNNANDRQKIEDGVSVPGSAPLPKSSCQVTEENLHTINRAHEDAVKFQIEATTTFEERGARDVNFEKTPTAQDLGTQSAAAQWPQPGEGDMASNVHEFAGRNRWYKKKAPHAMEQSEARMVQAAKDRPLIREIRSIYEDTYGVIDTKHRQSSADVSANDNLEPECQPAVTFNKQLSPPPLQPEDKSASTKHVQSSNFQTSKSYEDNVASYPEGMAMIQRLFEELHETGSLIQDHKMQLEEIPTTGESKNLLQSLNASEQRVLQTLKAAWDLLEKSAAAPSNRTDESPKESSIAEITKTALEASQLSEADIYRILAYDPHTQEVTTAKTTSLKGSPNETPLTLSEALAKVTNPAKFVPYFASLNRIGYEVVSGGANILVFKKVREEKPPAEDIPEVSANSTRHVNPIDGTTTQTGNFASPTGFVNHDSVLPPSASELEEAAATDPGQIMSGERVRREEPVFSGTSRTAWQDRYDQSLTYKAKMKSRLRRATRRRRRLAHMAWVALWTASCCYAVGLATEFLRG